jgi:hypothetical protein
VGKPIAQAPVGKPIAQAPVDKLNASIPMRTPTESARNWLPSPTRNVR